MLRKRLNKVDWRITMTSLCRSKGGGFVHVISAHYGSSTRNPKYKAFTHELSISWAKDASDWLLSAANVILQLPQKNIDVSLHRTLWNIRISCKSLPQGITFSTDWSWQLNSVRSTSVAFQWHFKGRFSLNSLLFKKVLLRQLFSKT